MEIETVITSFFRNEWEKRPFEFRARWNGREGPRKCQSRKGRIGSSKHGKGPNWMRKDVRNGVLFAPLVAQQTYNLGMIRSFVLLSLVLAVAIAHDTSYAIGANRKEVGDV